MLLAIYSDPFEIVSFTHILDYTLALGITTSSPTFNCEEETKSQPRSRKQFHAPTLLSGKKGLYMGRVTNPTHLLFKHMVLRSGYRVIWSGESYRSYC